MIVARMIYTVSNTIQNHGYPDVSSIGVYVVVLEGNVIILL